MPQANCSVIGCSNSTYKIKKLKKKLAQNRTLKLKVTARREGDCLECKPSFHLHTCPGPIKCKQLRKAWIKAVRREPTSSK